MRRKSFPSNFRTYVYMQTRKRGLREISALSAGSSPTGGATDLPATLLPLPEKLQAILFGDVFQARAVSHAIV